VNAAESPVRVTLQLATKLPGIPGQSEFTLWANRAMARAGIPLKQGSCVTIRLVDAAESQGLNTTFRNVPKPTNVLAFEAGPPSPATVSDETELGDLVICAAVVLQEAHEQAKDVGAHFAHMTIHGCLHLAGYDHIDDAEAEAMESLERQLMVELGFTDPYRDEDSKINNA
jgi:probable rRNA maturation factor